MATKSDKVLYLSRGGDVSGAQRQLYYLLRGLDRSRFTPFVICTEDGPFLDELRKIGVACRLQPLAGWRKGKHLLARYRDVAYLRRVVRDEGISLVHNSDIWLSEYMLRCSKPANLPCILHVRAPVSRRMVRTYRFSRATALVAISKRAEVRLAAMGALPREKIVLIHDAVDSQLFTSRWDTPAPGVLTAPYAVGDRVAVGIVGRVEKAKEQLAFIRIAKKVLARTDNAVFFIIGEEKDRAYCRRIARFLRDNGLEDRVHFTGRREDIGDVLADLDILVSLSGGSVRYEGMMAGLAVVCAWSRTAEESYHIRHNETGCLVPVRKEEPVAQVLLELIEDGDLRERIGRNARTWAQEHLGHAELVENTQNLYERLLAKAAAAASLAQV